MRLFFNSSVNRAMWMPDLEQKECFMAGLRKSDGMGSREECAGALISACTYKSIGSGLILIQFHVS